MKGGEEAMTSTEFPIAASQELLSASSSMSESEQAAAATSESEQMEERDLKDTAVSEIKGDQMEGGLAAPQPPANTGGAAAAKRKANAVDLGQEGSSGEANVSALIDEGEEGGIGGSIGDSAVSSHAAEAEGEEENVAGEIVVHTTTPEEAAAGITERRGSADRAREQGNEQVMAKAKKMENGKVRGRIGIGINFCGSSYQIRCSLHQTRLTFPARRPPTRAAVSLPQRWRQRRQTRRTHLSPKRRTPAPNMLRTRPPPFHVRVGAELHC